MTPTLKNVDPHDAHCAYAHSGDADRRIANQAFFTRLDIAEDEQLRPRLAEPFATIFREAHDSNWELREQTTTGSEAGFRVESRDSWGCGPRDRS